ncbi:MAG: hypothetical protein R3C12_18640 [Planctomycetaceae bacterium]
MTLKKLRQNDLLVFQHKLCLALGKTKAEINEMDGDEFSDWIAFDALHGLPDHYWMTGLVCEVLCAVMSDKKRRIDPYKWHPAGKPKRKQTPEEQKASFRRFKKS